MKSWSNHLSARIPVFAGAVALLCVSASASLAEDVKVAPRPIPPGSDLPTPPPVLPPKEPAPTVQATQTPPPWRPAKGELPEALAAIRPSIDPDVVYYQEPGDGSVWAYGGSYKASFTTAGATYIPHLATAPQNYPVTFHLASVDVGGQPLFVQDGVSAERSGDIVSFDRGSLVEQYLMQPGSMEQVFVFDSLPGRGDLVVRMDVATELSRSESNEGFRFANDYGHVGYGRAVAFDAAGNRTPAATILDGGSIEIRVPGSFLAGATLPLTIDPTVTTFTVDTPPSGQPDSSPDIAWDSTNAVYIVVWEREFNAGDHDIWSQFHTAAGTLVGGSTATIDFTSIYWARPRVANNQIADQFMVVAQVGAPAGGAREIWGCARAATGAVGGQFMISAAGAPDEFNPDIGGDPVTAAPTYYCVAWEAAPAAGNHNILGRLVRADTTFLGAVFGIDTSAGTLDQHPSVSKSDGEAPFATQAWTVVWDREFAPNDHDIWGSQIRWDGLITHPTFMVDFSGPPGDDFDPQASTILDDHALSGAERDYLVVYRRQDAGGLNDIAGRIMNGAAGLTPEFPSITTLENDGLDALDQVNPSVDSDGTGYAVAFSEQFAGSDYDVYVSTISRNGGALQVKERHALLDFSTGHDDFPQVTGIYDASGAHIPSRTGEVWSTNQGGGSIRGGLSDCEPFVSFCWPGFSTQGGLGYGGATTICPCGNPPTASGRGCNNFGAGPADSAMLTAAGTASLSADTVVLTSAGENNTSLTLFLSGNAPIFAGVAFGAGVRCIGGPLKRLYSGNASGGTISRPSGGPSLSSRHAALGDPLSVGTSRYYMAYYRDPSAAGPCASTAATFNSSQSGSLLWYP